jgi:glycosyltransferase involved in cell wall biosynthesis
MNKKSPRVTIGLPVYNGAQFIEEALDSLLAQTFTDFELIISDNASTDQTEQICRSYAARDKRIRYLRQAHNIGAGNNFNYVFERASGEYFKWVAHDDVYDAEFLSKCVSLLDEAPPSVVLCVPRIKLIDEQSNVISHDGFASKRFLTHNTEVVCELRFPEVLSVLAKGAVTRVIWGLMRTSALKKTRLFIPYHSGDVVLAAELSLLGTFWQTSDYLLSMRLHPKRPARSLKDENAWWGTPGTARAPVWLKLLGGFISAINRSKLSQLEKLYRIIQIQVFIRGRLQRHLFSPLAWKSRAWLTRTALKATPYTYVPLRIWALVAISRPSGMAGLYMQIREVWKVPGEQLRSILENRKFTSQNKDSSIA